MPRRPAAGADDFLPVLIYVVIHANPPQLVSNLLYIERFRMHSRMQSESAYFFTQLVCVVQSYMRCAAATPVTDTVTSAACSKQPWGCTDTDPR